MHAEFRVSLERVVFVALFFMPTIIAAQVAGNSLQQPTSAPGAVQPIAPQDLQAVSQTGLFPVFAVNMNFKGSLVDGADVPSKSANGGVDDTVQRAWVALKPGGFNTIVFKVDLTDPQAAARVANLCIWAKANSVALIPVLANASAANAAAAFPAAIVSRLRGGDGQQFAAYPQLSYFALESPINVPTADANMNLAEAQKALLAAVDSLRNAESQALQGTGVQSTPIIVNVSFDYELVQLGAIVGVPLDAAAEQKALVALKKSLQPFANAANINAVSVAWFPRSITSGDEGHFVSLLREVEAALPGKKVLLDTGFSTAFNSGDQQNQFMTVALTNLAGFRATDGADSRFLGVTVSQAFNNLTADAQAPAGTSDPAQWNWNEKAKQLAQVWSQGGKSADMTWWLEKVRAGRALLTTQGNDVVASPGLQAVQQFSATVARVNQSMTPAAISSGGQLVSSSAFVSSSADATANVSSTPAAPVTPGQAAGPSSPSFFKQTMQSLVQQVTTQLTAALLTKLTNKLTNSPAQAAYPAQPYAQNYNTTTNYPANPLASQNSVVPGVSPVQSGAGMIWLTPQDVAVDTTNPATGQAVHITAQLHNGTADQDISGLTVQMLDSANPTSPSQASQGGVYVPRSGVTPVQLTWTAGQASNATLLVQVLDSSGTQLASAPVPMITIANATSNVNAGVAANATPNAANASLQTAVNQPGQNFTSGSTNANAGATLSGANAGPQTAVSQGGPSAISGNASANAVANTNVPPNNSNSGAQSTASQPGQGTNSGNTATNPGEANGSNPASQSGQGQPGQGTPSTTQTVISTPPVQPKIAYFGHATGSGVDPSLSLQVTNPASTVISSAQAQLFVDGKPGPVQPLGPFLPNQTRSATFDGSAGAAGTHSIKVVVTTAEGASATAVASPVPLPRSSRVTDENKSPVGRVQGLPVRSGLPPGYRIGAVTTAPASTPAPASQGSGAVSANAATPGAPAAQTTGPQTPPGNQQSATSTPTQASPSNLSSASSVATTVPTRTNPAANNAATAPVTAGQTAGVRTLVPQGSGTNSASTATIVPQTRPNQTSTTTTPVVPANSSGQTTAVKTVVPQSSSQGTATTVLPSSSSGQPAGAKTVAPQDTAKTVLPPANSGQTAGVRTVAPQGTATTVLPPGNSGPTAGVKTVTPQGTAKTVLPPGNSSSTSGVKTVTPQSTATTVLPPGNSGQTAGVKTVAQQGTASTVLPPRPGQSATTQVGSQGAQGYVDLSVSAGDIRFRPAAPGQPLICTAVIHNLGTVATQGASVVFTLNADGKTLSSRPSVFNIGAGGAFQASWTSTMPAGQSVQLAVQVMARGDINAANNQAVVRLR